MYKLIKCPPKLNFIANSLNPLRDFVMILKLLNTMDKTIVGMEEEFASLQTSLTELLVLVVDAVEPNGVLRNWLYDDFDDELKVIDMLGQFKVLDLLQHPKMIKTVEYIWYGNYDWKKNTSFITTMKSTNAGIVYRSLNLTLDVFFSMFGPNKWFATLYYNYKILHEVIKRHFKRLRDHKMNKIDFENREMEKAPLFGYIAFVSSIYVQRIVDYVIFLLMSIIMIVFFVIMINHQKSLIQLAEEISTLQSQSQTTEIVAQTAEKYNELEETGDSWMFAFRACCIISCLFITNLLQDILIFTSYILRGISIKAFSKTFLLMTLVDLIKSAIIVTLIIRFTTEYQQAGEGYRSQEKNYQIMLATREGKFDAITMLIIIIAALFYRIVIQLVYFKSLGAFIQIIIKMAKDTLKFLLIFMIFIVAFTIFGYALFHDLEEYDTFWVSLNTMYASALGGFDFSIFEEATNTNIGIGKAYLALYLLVSAILLLNFLIAILSDTYASLINYGNGFQMAEIIKLRPIYEYHPHYHCLVKSLTIYNPMIFLLMPLVIIMKSKQLNTFLIHLEYVLMILSFWTFNGALVIAWLPLFVLIVLYLKVMHLFKKSKDSMDFIFRLIDIGVFALLSPLITVVIVILFLITGILNGFNSINIKKITEIYKEEHQVMNISMDGSIVKNSKMSEGLNIQKNYYLFKKFVAVSKKTTNAYDPSNMMLSEVTVCIMVAALKITKRKVQNSMLNEFPIEAASMYLPMTFVIKEVF